MRKKRFVKITIILLFLSFILLGCSENGGEKSKENKNLGNTKMIYNEKKEITWKSEGTPYTETFKLVNDKKLPFITYIPEKDWISEIEENRVVIKQKDYGLMEIVFLDSDITKQKQAEQIFLDRLKSYNNNLKKDEKSMPDWVISYYSFNNIDSNTYAILGRYNNQYFYICRFLDMEGAELFIPIEREIYNEWRWKDTNEKIELH